MYGNPALREQNFRFLIEDACKHPEGNVEARSNEAVSLRCALISLGLGFYWTWINLSGSNSLFFPWLNSGSFPLGFWLPTVGYLLAMALAALYSTRHREKPFRQSKILLWTTFAILGVIATFIRYGSGWLYLTGQTLSTCASAVVLLYWGAFFGSLGNRQIGVCGAASFIFSSAIYLLTTTFLSDTALRIALCLAILLQGLLLWALSKSQNGTSCISYSPELGEMPAPSTGKHREPSPEEKTSSSIMRCGLSKKTMIVLGSLVFCVLFDELIRILATPLVEAAFNSVGFLTQIGCLIISTLVITIALPSKRDLSFENLFIAVVLLLVLGFVSFLAFTPQRLNISFIIQGAGYWILNLFIWIALANLAKRPGVAVFPLFAFVEGGIRGMILIARPIGYYILSYTTVSSNTLSITLTIAVVVVVVVAMLILQKNMLISFNPDLHPEREKVNDEDVPNPQRETSSLHVSGELSPETVSLQEMDLVLQTIASEYDLTPREVEVLALLAQGRSIPYIERELVIAKSTAQTHSRHIYSKLGIHSKQELIDLVDSKRHQLISQ